MSLSDVQEAVRQTVDKSAINDLMRLTPGRVYIDILLSWIVIFGSFVFCSIIKEWWAFVLAFPVIGCAQYALFIIGHDGLHGSIHSDKKVNDLVARWFVYGPMFMGFEDGKRNHLEHHKSLGSPQDPDRYLHTFSNKNTPSKFLLFCSGLSTFLKTVIKVSPFAKNKLKTADVESPAVNSGSEKSDSLKRYFIERIPVMVWQPILFSTIVFALHLPFWVYIALWIAPIYFGVFVPDEIRAFCDHAILMRDDEAADEKRLVSFDPPLLERLYFSPHEMNYHAEHHLWARIPYYNLPKAHKLVRDCGSITVRRSYMSFLFEVLAFLGRPVEKN